MARPILLICISLASLVGLVADAAACSCIQVGPACQAFWKTDAVFDATVEAIESATRTDNVLRDRPLAISEKVVKLTVRESWKGVEAGALEVVTADNGAACGYDFKPGRRYLVFAWKRPLDGRWSASLCSATREFDGSGDAASFLASLSRPPSGGRVFGSVKALEQRFDLQHSTTERRVETPLRLVGGGQERRALSTDGRPAARLEVEATDPAARPHPIYGLPVRSARTDADGDFEITGLPPGRYILGVNLKDLPSQYNPYSRTLYPSDGGDGDIVTIGTAHTFDIGTWRLPPPLAVIKVSGVAVWPDEKPAAGVYVSVSDVTGNPIDRARGAGGAVVDADGRFVIELRQGRTYTFIVRDKNSALLFVAGPRLVVGPTAPDPVRLVIRPTVKQ